MTTRTLSPRTMLGLLLAVTPWIAVAGWAQAPAPDAGTDWNADWNAVLSMHWEDGGLDYAALASDRAPLDRYLGRLRDTDAGGLSDDEELAFWINAYNAVTVHHVLERYPGIESVRNVDGFFDELMFEVAGENLTLDEIEDKALESGDERVHFAVVCASTSCPELRHEAYDGSRLEAQLADQTTQFLADTGKGLRYDAEDERLYLSSIFKWYAGDFTGGSTVVAFFARGKVIDWLLPRLPEALASRIRADDPSVSYMDYDWSLNDR